MAVTDRIPTGEDLLAMGDVGPCEPVDGKIVRFALPVAELFAE